jgi:hypothetical protein
MASQKDYANQKGQLMQPNKPKQHFRRRRHKPSNKGKPSYNAPKKRSFVDSLYDHWAMIDGKRVDHWGHKDFCKLCDLNKTTGQFQNEMTRRGLLLLGILFAAVLAGLTLYAIFFAR